MTQEEVKQLFKATDYSSEQERIRKRDKVILVLLYSCGLRRNEVVNLKIKDVVLCLLTIGTVVQVASAQHKEYYPDPDTAIQRRLEEWKDLKFGLLMHWGTYSQWGIVESWSICPEDEDWCTRRGPYAHSYFAYVEAYEKLQTTFNPTEFDPTRWAKAAKNAGMKYMVFTTKHHDGFCMFDSKLSNYTVANPNCPNSQSAHPVS